MEYPPCNKSVRQKYFCYSLPRKKVGVSIGNMDLFAYSILKNIENSSGQGVVQSEPNWNPRLTGIFRL